MKYVFLGAPGVGKGTQALTLAKELGLAHISTGEMLRAAVEEGSELGRQAKGIMDAGQLIPDELMIALIEKRIQADDCGRGCILDGFPRTVAQAEALDKLLDARGEKLGGVVFFVAPRDELVTRLSHRRAHEGRADDTVEVQEKRLKVYEEQTAPLVDYYEKIGLLVRVDAVGNIGEVYSRLREAVGARAGGK